MFNSSYLLYSCFIKASLIYVLPKGITVKIPSEGTLNRMLLLLLAVAGKQKFHEFIFLDDVLTNET